MYLMHLQAETAALLAENGVDHGPFPAPVLRCLRDFETASTASINEEDAASGEASSAGSSELSFSPCTVRIPLIVSFVVLLYD